MRPISQVRKEIRDVFHSIGEVNTTYYQVALHENFMVKWKSVDEIEHTDWMLGYDNDSFNICFNKAAHEKKLKENPYFGFGKEEIFKFIEKNKKHFFIAR